MEGLVFIFMILVTLGLFGLAAVFLGVDSTDSSRDPRQPLRQTGIITY